ncbi:MAG: hypothetical protein ACHQU0_01345 [Candidatus Paceibacteria bacterium]
MTETAFEPESTGETDPTPLSIEADVPAVLVHDSVEEPPADVANEVGLAEILQAGIADVITVTTGGGGGGGMTGTGAPTQQGPASCAKTCVGVVSPVAKAIVIPKKTVTTNVKNPTRIGL